MYESEFLQLVKEQSPWVSDWRAIEGDEKVAEALSREHRLLYRLEYTGNLLVVGPRRSGKTTLLKLLAYDLIVNRRVDSRRVVYVSCEPLYDHRDLIELFRLLDREGVRFIFLDEVTFVEGWEKAVKYYLDSKLRLGKVLYATGSTTAFLKREPFPGRDIRVALHLPVEFRRFVELFADSSVKKALDNESKLRFHVDDLNYMLLKYLECGGFPELMYQLMEEGRVRASSIEALGEWIEGDVAKLGRSIRLALCLLRGVVARYGTRVSLSSLAKDFELGSHKVAREYLELLEEMLVLRQVLQADPPRRLVVPRRERKVYLTDPALYGMYLRRLLYRKLGQEDIPKLIEGAVAEYLFRRYGEVYYSYQSGRETDFTLLDHPTGIEVKWQERISERDFSNPHLFKRRILVSRSQLKQEGRVEIVPACMLLLRGRAHTLYHMDWRGWR
ncbi:MAG: hypothetical protein DRN96_05075 [Thermoproteota archaeon]|nr:MAG: hypothetical protein DRN96_05075 [Candidatus Korarchaeota archaeon]